MIIDNPNHIELFRLLTIKAALSLEIAGLTGRGKSAYSLAKKEFGLKGNKQKVFDQVNAMVQAIKQQKGEING